MSMLTRSENFTKNGKYLISTNDFHRFPVYYSESYYKRLKKDSNDSLCIGAFYKNKYIIGMFIGQYKYNSLLLRNLTNKSYFSCDHVCGLYIATIGVIDEVRRLGIGSQLINHAIKYTKENDRADVVYLHVIEYNQAAIMFYKK